MMNECYASDRENHIFLMGGKRFLIDDCGSIDYYYSETVNYFQIYEVSLGWLAKCPPLPEASIPLEGLLFLIASTRERIIFIPSD